MWGYIYRFVQIGIGVWSFVWGVGLPPDVGEVGRVDAVALVLLWGLRLRFSGFGIEVSVFGFRFSVFGLWFSVFGSRVWGFGFRAESSDAIEHPPEEHLSWGLRLPLLSDEVTTQEV